MVRTAAMVGSCIGVGWSLMAFHKANKSFNYNKEQGISFCGGIFYFIWRVCEFVPRIIVIALFAAQFGYITCVLLGIHWVVMSVSVWVQGQKKKGIIFVSFLLGYTSIFAFLNSFNGQTRYRALYHYSITFTENIIILTLWGYFTEQKHDLFYFAVIGSIPGLMVIQLIFQILYYSIFHPKSTEIKISVYSLLF